MATSLYEVLELSKDASTEQIRKAYKRKALQTHPDRLPPTASAAEKTSSEEQFRKVNNAYEILSDPEKRKEYDQHGVWPPPEPELEDFVPRNHSRNHSYHHQYGSRSNTFPDPFFGPRSPFSSFGLSDPFVLFDSIFGFDEFPRARHSPHRHHHRPSPPMFNDPFEQMHRMHAEIGGMMANMERDMLTGMGGSFSNRDRLAPTPGFLSVDTSPFESGQGRWTSESFMTSTVNGITQTVHKRRDWDGNEHVTRSYADGREVHTINGIEQPSSPRGYLPHSSHTDSRHLPPSPDGRHHSNHNHNQIQNAPAGYVVPPPPYQTPTGGYGVPHADESRRRDRRHSEKHLYSTDNAADRHRNEDRHSRKWWWQNGR